MAGTRRNHICKPPHGNKPYVRPSVQFQISVIQLGVLQPGNPKAQSTKHMEGNCIKFVKNRKATIGYNLNTIVQF
jgi:hypothetical protein